MEPHRDRSAEERDTTSRIGLLGVQLEVLQRGEEPGLSSAEEDATVVGPFCACFYIQLAEIRKLPKADQVFELDRHPLSKERAERTSDTAFSAREQSESRGRATLLPVANVWSLYESELSAGRYGIGQ